MPRSRPLDPRRACLALAGFAALAFTILLASPAGASYHALEQIPTESPLYRMVDDLAASYGAPTSFLHTRPWDRADLGRFLDELVTNTPAAGDDPLVVRLRRELSPGEGAGSWEPMLAVDDSSASLELSPYLRANYADDRARGAIVRDFRAGLQGSYAPSENTLLFADVFAGTSSPGGHGNPVESKHFGLVEGVQFNSYYDRAYGVWRGRLGRVTAGHTWLRWGPGTWGTMGLSDGAPAFDLLEVRAPLFRRAQVEWFVASLDPAVQSYLAGHRLALRPSEKLELAFGELARFDGTANLPLYLLPVTPYSLVEKRLLHSSSLPSDSLDRTAKNNVLWTLDASWRYRRGLRLYGELAIDDISFSSEKRPRALAWQMGFDARRVRGGSAWTLRGEYSRVYQYTYSVFHHHDFAFAGLPTGFPLGPDVDRLNGRLEYRTSPEWAFGLEGAFTRKGEGRLGQYYVPGSGAVNNLVLSGVLDQDARAAGTLDYSPAAGLQLGATAGWARVKALAHVFGNDESGAYGETRVTLRW